jgi:hypothetical protein
MRNETKAGIGMMIRAVVGIRSLDDQAAGMIAEYDAAIIRRTENRIREKREMLHFVAEALSADIDLNSTPE